MWRLLGSLNQFRYQRFESCLVKSSYYDEHSSNKKTKKAYHCNQFFVLPNFDKLEFFGKHIWEEVVQFCFQVLFSASNKAGIGEFSSSNILPSIAVELVGPSIMDVVLSVLNADYL